MINTITDFLKWARNHTPDQVVSGANKVASGANKLAVRASEIATTENVNHPSLKEGA